tara:strand:+ start:2443 stop:2601 length:159 start_codon:yes stop_codon:yes gene_type:complete
MKTKLTKKELVWVWSLVSLTPMTGESECENEEWENMQEKISGKLGKMIGELK